MGGDRPLPTTHKQRMRSELAPSLFVCACSLSCVLCVCGSLARVMWRGTLRSRAASPWSRRLLTPRRRASQPDALCSALLCAACRRLCHRIVRQRSNSG